MFHILIKCTICQNGLFIFEEASILVGKPNLHKSEHHFSSKTAWMTSVAVCSFKSSDFVPGNKLFSEVLNDAQNYKKLEQ